ncbi:MAG: cache domain-containing protein [Arcobacter sp.]|nr:cache domain-containing protein [Arcobacter sp.]
MKLSKFIRRFIFLTAFSSLLLAFLISVLYQYHNFENDMVHIKKEFTEQKKKEVKNEVLMVYNLVEHKEELLKKEVERRLKEKVNLAYGIAKNIYETNKNKKTDEEIKYLIALALKDLTYENDNTYFFINSNKGQAILFNKEIKFDKYHDVWNLKDDNGNFIIQNQSKIALEKKEGFLINTFIKPDSNDTKQYSKLSYVKLFEPFNWHIGIGEYIDELREKNKKELLNWIASLRFENSGYIFVNSTNGETLVFEGNIVEVKPHPFPELMKQQLETAQNPNGDFYEYKFKKPNTVQEFDKVSFIKKYDEYNWIIGCGVYLDELDNELKRKEEIFKETINNQIKSMLIMFLVLAVVIYLLSKRISTFINYNINSLIQAFSKASQNNEKINTEELTYKEFVSLADNLNKTLENKNMVEKKLQDYIQIVNQNVIISTTNKEGKIQNVSEAFCKVSGYSKDELIGKTHSLVKHPETSSDFYKDMWNQLLSGKEWKGEIKNKSKDGKTYWVYAIITPILINNEIQGFTAIRNNITDKKYIEQLSITDELTKLYNRRFFNNKIEEEINRAKRENKTLCLLILDIDYFKQYNDTYGHQKGDFVLESVAKVLANRTNRASDFAFRLGGEEFAIITTLEKEKAIEFAEVIRSDIEKLKIEHKSSTISKHLTISIGLVSKYAIDIENSDKLYKEADDNLYIAKKQGRNSIYYNEDK